jgi:hypothetical protein
LSSRRFAAYRAMAMGQQPNLLYLKLDSAAYTASLDHDSNSSTDC